MPDLKLLFVYDKKVTKLSNFENPKEKIFISLRLNPPLLYISTILLRKISKRKFHYDIRKHWHLKLAGYYYSRVG